MSDKIPYELVKKNLDNLGFDLKRKGGEAFLEDNGRRIEISAHSGQITEDGIMTLKNFILKRRKDIPERDLALLITKRPNFYRERAPNYLIAIFTAGLIFFGLERLNVTGFILSNISNSTANSVGSISNSTANIGILICALGMIGLLLWKWRK